GAEVLDTRTVNYEDLAVLRETRKLGDADTSILLFVLSLARDSGADSICVVTLDGDLARALKSRGIRSIPPNDLLAIQSDAAPDAQIQSSADSIIRSQRLYLL